MRAHILDTGRNPPVVENTIVVSSPDFPVGPGRQLLVSDEGEIGWLFVDGRLVPPDGPAPTFLQLVAAKIAEVDSVFAARASALMADYPEGERLTWMIQHQEAVAWAADSSTPTPYLDGLAQVRGIEPADMRERTYQQVQQFTALSKQLVGTRQRLRDEISAVLDGPDAAQRLAEINWNE
ncbi:hypothetical protein SB816_28375 [Achromobacter sp. SIMBA_011]|uniref:hypothetical protein n=1 Tax=Achromobacter TaxID=222 RepID=UPI0035569B26